MRSVVRFGVSRDDGNKRENVPRGSLLTRSKYLPFYLYPILIERTEIVTGWSFLLFLMLHFLLHLHPLIQMFRLKFIIQRNYSPRWPRKMA
jgi:hypothetical protein